MTKKVRYLILVAGFLTFCVLAPLIVLYVTGITFDFTTHQFHKTGLIILTTDPKTDKVYLDGQLRQNPNGNIKFLAPNEYDLEIKKDGYFGWSKRLTVKDGQVTWASPPNNKIYLFLKNPQANLLGSGILDFSLNGNKLIYLTPSVLTVTKLQSQKDSQNFSLPNAISKLAVSPNGQLALLTGSDTKIKSNTVLVLDLSNGNISDISSLSLEPESLKFSAENQLYGSENGNIYQVDYQNSKKNLFLKNILAFNFQGNDLYYLSGTSSAISLKFLPKNSKDSVELISGIPNFKFGQILVSFDKEIFLLLDNNLYQVNGTLQKLADDVSEWKFYPEDSVLAYTNSAELNYYNPFDHQVHFVTRSQSLLTNPLIKLNLGQSFFFRNKQLMGVELDTRDHQNEYNFYSATAPQKLEMDTENKNLILLDNGELKILKVR